MRLRRLDLTRYGKFTDGCIDFGERPANEPDLHIVYGPNEAGKSTALAAFLDLLFGIEARSRYNFLHSYPTMRIGAAIETSGGIQEIVRIKKAQSGLLDARGQAISENLIAGELGGLDRGAYRTMFSLDDETLEAGGESILASKGDLGQLLFSATAGLADLSRTLTGLRDEADKFYKFHAHSGELARLKNNLSALRKEREGVDTAASDYVRLAEAKRLASEQYETALAERGRVQAQVDAVQRRLAALPRLEAFARLSDRLLPLSGLPEAPAEWRVELPRLQSEGERLRAETDGAAREIERVAAELEAIAVDEAAQRMSVRLEGLGDLPARNLTAISDIPKRQQEMRELELRGEDILRRLDRAGETKPERLLLTGAQTEALRELLASQSGVTTGAAAAQQELADAVHRHSQARFALVAASGRDDGDRDAGARFPDLAATLAAVRASDHASRARSAERAIAERRERLGQRLDALRPWRGNADQVAALSVPPASVIATWKDDEKRARASSDKHSGEVERAEDDRARLAAELEAIRASSGVMDDQQAAAIRGEREAAWAAHRDRLDLVSADLFEATLRRDDLFSAARLGRERERAKLHEAERAVHVANAALERALGLRAAANERQDRVRDAIGAAIHAMSPDMPDAMAASDVETWLGHRAEAIGAQEALREAERELRDARTEGTAALDRLRASLDAASIAAPPESGLDALQVIAQNALDGEARLATLRNVVADHERDVATRERTMQQARTADQKWAASWKAACARTWLADAEDTPEPAAVAAILKDVAELGPIVQSRAVLVVRIADMQADQARFTREMEAIAGELSMKINARATFELVRDVEVRVRTAQAAQTENERLDKALRAGRERGGEIAERLAAHDRRRVEMTGFLAVGTLAEVGEKLRDIETRTDLRQRAEEEKRELLATLRVHSIEQAEHDLAGADRDALELELSILKTRFENLDTRTLDLFATSKAAADRIEAVAGDDAAARVEERRRTTLLDIEDKTIANVRLRIGIAAAEQALRAYRDRHRSSMLRQASEAFRMISRGAYRGLGTRPEKDGEILIAVGADSGAKVASDLSKGTRFQLYLALRAAGYHEYARQRSPVPFIADDIMETFDDFRAEEAFRLFGDMARVGQVIYLTHHQHLCAIARQLLPGVRVHSLAA